MANSTSEDQTLSRRLYHIAGWRQGSLFALPGVAVLVNAPMTPKGSGIEIECVPCQNDERLVIVTQDCDIISGAESSVEALVCRVSMTEEDRRDARSIIRDSARKLILDWQLGIVVDSQRRVIIRKPLLETITPLDWMMPPETRREFVNWLAWRFNRPPVADEHVDSIQGPLKELMRKVEKKDPDRLTDFLAVVHDVRIRYPTAESNEATVLFVLKDVEPGIDQADAIDYIREEFQQVIAKKGRYVLRSEAVPYSELLLRDYEATLPLHLDYLTRWGIEFQSPTGVFRQSR